MPVFHAARVGDVASARHAIASGKVDMIGMTRAHLADPHIVHKILEGREEDIRPCVGANYCLDRIYQGGEAYCIHNPSSGRELTLPHSVQTASARRKIVVAGAGPAGLEAARVSAERGHDVVVLEASGKPGGQLRLAAQSPRRREMLGIVDWRVEQCQKLGVAFQFDTWADVETVTAHRPDVVFIATGGVPHTEVLKRGDDLVVSAWDILSGQVKPGAEVLLFDDAGDHTALQAAEVIAAAGGKVEIVTPDRTFAPEIMAMNLVPYMRSLQTSNVTFTVTYRLSSVALDGNRLRATLGSDYGAVQEDRVVDQVVVNHGTRPVDDLYFDLKPLSRNLGAVDYAALLGGAAQSDLRNPDGLFELYRLGDAVAARNVHAAIYDAARLAKDI
jgi:NADPH-dependent 2,4-dienoyl-CoA reductase/sulfur reductase-like enzyme